MYEGGGLFPLLEHFCIGKDLVQLAHKGDDIAVIQRTMIHGNGDGQDLAHRNGVVARASVITQGRFWMESMAKAVVWGGMISKRAQLPLCSL